MSGAVLFGKFQLLELLGSGGMAEVWRARVNGASGFSRDVVVKRILAGRQQDPELAAMFAREARLSARLHHSNIVQVFDYGVVEGDPYLAMEYVEGVDLHWVQSCYRKTGARLPPALAAYVAREVARALKHVHEAVGDDGQPLGLVHRDISPSNVLLTLDGAVKLFDFGVAKSAQESPLTATGGFRGKVAYTAPEVAEGKPHDARSDVFALGVVLYELLAGRRLFQGESDAQTFGLVRAAVVTPLSERDGIDPALDAVVLRALARLPGDRTESAEAFIAQLDPLVRALGAGPEQLSEVVKAVPRRKLSSSSGSRSSEVPAPHTAATPPPTRAPRWRVGAIAFALLVAGLAAVGLLREGEALPEGRPVAALESAATSSPRAPLGPSSVAAPDTAPSPGAAAEASAAEPRLDGGGAPAAADPAAAPRAAVERYLVRSAPPGATVRTDLGEVLGTTPLERSWSDADRPRRLLLERAGYERGVLEVPARGRVLSVALKQRRKAPERLDRVDLRDGNVVDPFR